MATDAFMCSKNSASAPERWVQSAGTPTPSVLMVESDATSVTRCTRMLEELNYTHHCVGTAREALDRIVKDPKIQVILAPTEMQSMDGFALVDEARVRVGATRPLAAVMLAEQVTADLAVRGMHAEAVDMVTKPLGFDACSAALRRAIQYLAARQSHAAHSGISNVEEQLSRLVAALEDRRFVERLPDARIEVASAQEDVKATLRTLIGSRNLRGRYFPSEMFADPAWDILLDLARAKFEGQDVSVSSVCIAASVPMSTALRWVRQMTEAGLLHRWMDPKDRRRDLIALTDSTADHMRDYLGTVKAMISKL